MLEHTGLLKVTIKHCMQVEKLSMQLFRELQHLHELDATWQSILRFGARYHDLGNLNGAKGHHKNSAKLINSGFIDEIPEQIRPLVALCARYHRKAEPKGSHPEFAILSKLEQDNIRKIASILRIADALDYNHESSIFDIEAETNNHEVVLFVHCEGSCDEELERLEDKKALFEKVYKRALICYHR